MSNCDTKPPETFLLNLNEVLNNICVPINDSTSIGWFGCAEVIVCPSTLLNCC